MPKACLGVCLFLGWIASGAFAATAQEVVHAVSGTISSIDSPAQTIEINADDGSVQTFKDSTKSHVPLDIDKKLLARLAPADKAGTKGTHVIVFYYGNYAVPTAVGLESLGPGPFETMSGSVTKFEKHQRVLTINSSSGADKEVQIIPTTVAETAVGVVEGYRFDPEKGEQVRVTASSRNGKETALYIYAK
jgi:hypothetical protein